MSLIDDLLARNRQFASSFSQGGLPASPRLHLAVVACMDARMDVFAILGLEPGDAQVIRNAGGMVSDDVLRSLVVSQWVSGTEEIVLLHHTDCGMTKFDEGQLTAEVAAHAGGPLRYRLRAFPDPEADLLSSVVGLRNAPELRHRDRIRGFLYDVTSGGLREVG